MDTKRIRVDEMTPEESVRLFAARLPIEYTSSDVQLGPETTRCGYGTCRAAKTSARSKATAVR
jgi:hypothetical protein